MKEDHVPQFMGAYLEDSYFLGIFADGSDLRLKCLFALTTDNPAYTSPAEGEAHCYRAGSIVIERPTIVQWLPGKPHIMQDLDGTFDFGGIELYRTTPGRLRLVTEWFDATFETAHLRLEFLDA